MVPAEDICDPLDTYSSFIWKTRCGYMLEVPLWGEALSEEFLISTTCFCGTIRKKSSICGWGCGRGWGGGGGGGEARYLELYYCNRNFLKEKKKKFFLVLDKHTFGGIVFYKHSFLVKEEYLAIIIG